jgi:predicted hydrocarbon binding protein
MGSQLNFKEVQKKVLNLLDQSPHGLTTSEIAEKLGINRITMGKYLEMIQLMGAIKNKKIGPANLWFIPKEVVIIKNYVRESLHPIVDKMIKGEKTPLPTLWDEFQLMLFKVSKIGLEVNGSANYIFYEIGEGIAREVLQKYVRGKDLKSVLESALPVFAKLKIGELELKSVDMACASLNLHNCPACTGMPVINAPFCHIEAGLISGIINSKLDDVQVKEIKCTSLRENLCQFEVKIQD